MYASVEFEKNVGGVPEFFREYKLTDDQLKKEFDVTLDTYIREGVADSDIISCFLEKMKGWKDGVFIDRFYLYNTENTGSFDIYQIEVRIDDYLLISHVDIIDTLKSQLERDPTPAEVKAFIGYVEIDIPQFLIDNAKSWVQNEWWEKNYG